MINPLIIFIFKNIGEIICIFFLVPHIRQLVHNQNSNMITRIKHCSAHWVMCTSYCIKTRFLQSLATVPFCLLKCLSTYHAIIMMYTGSSKLNCLTIYLQSMYRIKRQYSDSKIRNCFITYFIIKPCRYMTLI